MSRRELGGSRLHELDDTPNPRPRGRAAGFKVESLGEKRLKQRLF
jgi:hypothetical protein